MTSSSSSLRKRVEIVLDMALTTVSSLDEAFTAAPIIISGEGDPSAETDGQKADAGTTESAMVVEESAIPDKQNGLHEEVASEGKSEDESAIKDEKIEEQPSAEQASEGMVVETTPVQEDVTLTVEGDTDTQT